MKKHTRDLFLKPLLFQEAITYVVLAPVVFFFFYSIKNFRDNFLEALILVTSVQSLFALPLGIWVKYHFVQPAIDVMEHGFNDDKAMQKAIRSASLLPFAESWIIFIRWGVIVWVSVALPMFMKGHLAFEELVFGGIILLMTGIMAGPFYYLASENSLLPFYKGCNMNGILDSNRGFLHISLNVKHLITILFIAVPPIGLLLGTIYLSIYTGLKLESFTLGFILILVQTVFMTLLNGFLLMKSLSASVGKMSFLLEDMAKGEGDLTKRLQVTGLNEVGKLAFWFNDFMQNIEEIVTHVKGTSLELHQSIEDVNTGAQDLSKATQEQTASVEEITASIEDMNGTIMHNAELINECQTASIKITKLIDHSRKVFSALLAAIQEVSRDSRKIGDIVSTVNEVAFHTNLLALNASVEAARAGEHGKGFAVVAGEVRSLAQRSAEAANEIRTLIGSTVERIKTGDEMVSRTSESLEELMSQMELFFSMMETVSASSTEQTQRISELNLVISQIDRSTQQNSSTVEELANTMDNVQSVADVLAKDVQKFKTS